MRWDGFGRGVLFAAVAAFATGVWLVVASPWLGGGRALALSLVATTVVYVAGLGGDRRSGVGAGLVAVAAGAVLLVVAPGLRELAVGLAVVLAVARSAVLYRRRVARTIVVEGVLIVGGLALAAYVGSPSLSGAVVGVWAFLLVQSCFFLVPGAAGRSAFDDAHDPFEAAHARALALLDGDPS